MMSAEEMILKRWIPKHGWDVLKSPRHQNRFRETARLVVGEDFVDIGCALGFSTNHLKKFHPGNWSGLDYSVTSVDLARMIFPDIRFYYSGTWRILPICGRFDTVVCGDVLNNIDKGKEYVAELERVARKRIIFNVPIAPNAGDKEKYMSHNEQSLRELFDGYDYELIRERQFFYMVVNK